MTIDLSPTTRALLRAARSDGPSAVSRAKILSGVAAGTGGAAIGAAAKATLGAGSAKLLVAGALFGSAVTVGIAAMLLHVGAPKLAPDPTYAVHADSDFAAIVPAARGTALDETTSAAHAPPTAKHDATVTHATRAAHANAVASVDPLPREAALVAEARSALVRGEPEVALGALRATATLSSRAMEPEELSLEARALRAAGRDPEAAFVESQLRARFPDNALAR